VSDRHISDDEIGRELLVEALAWFIRRAQWLCAVPMPLVSHLLRDDLDGGRRFDRYLSSHGMTDEKAAGVLRYYGLIPRKRQPGEKGKTFSERIDGERDLRNYESSLLEARWIHRHVPRKVKDAAAIVGAMWSPLPEELRPVGELMPDTPPALFRDLCEIVARHRAGKAAIRPLVAAYAFGCAPPVALKRLAALRKCAKRRTN
jgi:hypothetical protein